MLKRKTKLDTTKVVIFTALIDSYICHNEFVSVKDVLWKYNKMKKETNNHQASVEYTI